MTKNDLYRIIKFGIVGGSGVIVNQGTFMLLSLTTLGVATRSPIAIFTALTSNFILNNFWTWQDRAVSRKRDLTARYLKFFIASGGTAFLFNYLPLLYMVNKLGWNENLSNFIGIAVASIANYFISHFWTFKHINHDDDLQELYSTQTASPEESIHYLVTKNKILSLSITTLSTIDTLPKDIQPLFEELPQGTLGEIRKGKSEETIAIELIGKGFITLYDTIVYGDEESMGSAFYAKSNEDFMQWWENETVKMNR